MSVIQQYTNTLAEKDGIYFSEDQRKVSYPDDGYDRNFYLEENSYWYRHRNQCIIEVVKRFGPDAHFFDIGGGNGYVAKGLQDNGITAILVEPGQAGALNAKKRGLEHIVCASLENGGFAPASLSAVGLFDVVEHIAEDAAFLKAINQALREDGRLFLTVPAYAFLFSAIDQFAGHFRRYTISGMTKKLEAAGFKVEYASYIFSLLPIPVFLFRTLPYWLGHRPKHQQIDAQSRVVHREKGIAVSMLDHLWRWEYHRLSRGKRIPFGGSCLIVAKKGGK